MVNNDYILDKSAYVIWRFSVIFCQLITLMDGRTRLLFGSLVYDVMYVK